MIEITPKRLYIIGIFSFLIVGISNSVSLIQHFQALSIWGKLASIGGIIFNFALVGLFKYLLDLEPKVENVAQSDDIGEIIEALNQNETKTKREQGISGKKRANTHTKRSRRS